MHRGMICMIRPAVVILVLVSASCGGSTKTVTKTAPTAAASTSSATTQTPTTSTGSTGAGSTTATGQPCPVFTNVKQVTPGLTCTASNGMLLTLEHQSGALHLKTLTARVANVSTAETLSGSVSSATAQGRFVVITLDITNNADSPETFAPAGNQQTALLGAGNKSYSEDFDAENGPDQNSCVSNDNPIQPGADLHCDVVYDIPTAAVDRARTHGLGLIVVNFGDDLSPNAVSTPSSAGIIILNPLGNA